MLSFSFRVDKFAAVYVSQYKIDGKQASLIMFENDTLNCTGFFSSLYCTLVIYNRLIIMLRMSLGQAGCNLSRCGRV